jgi:hypothetical protein
MVALIGALEAQAALEVYNIGFSGGGSGAYGQIDVVDGSAVNGSLTITTGHDQGTYSLVPGQGSIRLYDGTDLIYDNLVNAASNPFLDADGLAFVGTAVNNVGQPLVGVNLWGNSDGSYTLFLDPPYGAVNGSAAISSAPEPDTFGVVTGLGLLASLPLCRRSLKLTFILRQKFRLYGLNLCQSAR